MALLALAALVALVFAGVAFVVSVLDDDETTTPSAQTTAAETTAPPPAPPPPPPAPSVTPLEAPSGTVLVAQLVATADGLLADTRSRVGEAPSIVPREEGVYEVDVPGLSPTLRRRSVIRVRPVDGATGAMVSARKMGPRAEFLVFTRDGQTGTFAGTGFEFAVFLPQQDVKRTTAEAENGRPQLPGTR
jgi:hypothetical protein